jgi:hypothetical protein
MRGAEGTNLVVVQMAKAPPILLIRTQVLQQLATHTTPEAPRMPPCPHCTDNSAYNHTSTTATRESTTTSDRWQLCDALPTAIYRNRRPPGVSITIVRAPNIDRYAWDIVGSGDRDLWTWATVIHDGNRDFWSVHTIIRIGIWVCGERDPPSLWRLGSGGPNRRHCRRPRLISSRSSRLSSWTLLGGLLLLLTDW